MDAVQSRKLSITTLDAALLGPARHGMEAESFVHHNFDVFFFSAALLGLSGCGTGRDFR